MLPITVQTVGPQGFGLYQFDQEALTLEPTDGPSDHVLAPGFVDVHIHGAYGVDFMTSSSQQLHSMAHRLRQDGYEAILPTTVTASFEATSAAVDKVAENELFVGFHLEGPFLSPRHPGAQPPEAIIPVPDGPSEWDVLFDHPLLRQITLAPEIANAANLIQRLHQRAVVVSMGHTDATYEQIEEAVDVGVSQSTHTYNAMTGLHHRKPGGVGAALTDDRIFTELIYDRTHVSQVATDVLLRCKPKDRIIAVSDATQAAGMPSGSRFQMWGMDVVTENKQVRLLNGTLAGSAITLLDAFQNLWQDFGPEVAIRACCLNPRLQLSVPIRQWNLFDQDRQMIDQFRANPSQ